MEDVINWAIHEGIRTDESNPCGDQAAASSRCRSASTRSTHHPSLPFEQAPAFLAELRAQEGVKARALEFVMLTAVRVADICGGGKAHSEPMKWSHVDLAGRALDHPRHQDGPAAHRAAERCRRMRLLGEMRRFRDPATDFVFPGANARHRAQRRHVAAHAEGDGLWRRSRPRTACGLLQDLGQRVHGLSRRTSIEMAWPTPRPNWTRPICAANYLDKRRRLMGAWATFLEGEAMGSVVPLRA